MQNTLYMTPSVDPQRSLDPEVENRWSKLTPIGSTEWLEVMMSTQDPLYEGLTAHRNIWFTLLHFLTGWRTGFISTRLR